MGEVDEATEARAPWIREAIQAGQPFHIRHKTPLAHNAKNLGALAALLGALALVIALGDAMPGLAYVPLAATVFGILYFGIFVLVVHEASHDMFLIARSRARRTWLNRVFGGVVSVCLAASHYVHHWEEGHLEHHVRPLEPADPQKHNTLTGRTLLLRALGCLLIPGFLFFDRTVLRQRHAEERSSSSSLVILTFASFWLVVVVAASLAFGLHVGLALFFGLQVLVTLNHVKGALEHGGVALRDEPDAFLRSRSTFFPGRALLMPFNISLHFEHHLNYRVPWYELMRYHRALAPIVPAELHAFVWNEEPLTQLRGGHPPGGA